jgi:glucokinase
LQNIFEFLRDVKHAAVPESIAAEIKSGDPAATISHAALSGGCDICLQALDIFVAAYGAEAGNFALNILATGGVYIGGGIAPKIHEKIRSKVFTEAFLQKGRMRPLLETVPIHIILNEQTALNGAARGAWLRFAKQQ